MRMPWTDALARVLEAGVALVTGNHALARDQLERANAALVAQDMVLHAAMVRRRIGELMGGDRRRGIDRRSGCLADGSWCPLSTAPGTALPT